MRARKWRQIDADLWCAHSVKLYFVYDSKRIESSKWPEELDYNWSWNRLSETRIISVRSSRLGSPGADISPFGEIWISQSTVIRRILSDSVFCDVSLYWAFFFYRQRACELFLWLSDEAGTFCSTLCSGEILLIHGRIRFLPFNSSFGPSIQEVPDQNRLGYRVEAGTRYDPIRSEH